MINTRNGRNKRRKKKSKMGRKNLKFHFYDCHKDAMFAFDTKCLVKRELKGGVIIIDQWYLISIILMVMA